MWCNKNINSETFFPARLFWSYISSTGNIPLGLLLTSKLIRHYIMGQYLPWTGPICLPLSQGGVWSMKLCPPGLGIPPNKIDLLWLLLAETLARCKILFRTHQGANYNPLSDSWPVLCHLRVYLFISLIDQVNESTTICRSLQYNLIASSAIANVFHSFMILILYWYWYISWCILTFLSDHTALPRNALFILSTDSADGQYM